MFYPPNQNGDVTVDWAQPGQNHGVTELPIEIKIIITEIMPIETQYEAV